MKKVVLLGLMIFAGLAVMMKHHVLTKPRRTAPVGAAFAPSSFGHSAEPSHAAAVPVVANGPVNSSAILADQALDERLNDDERWHAAFELTERRPIDVAAVARVASAPYDIKSARASFEIGVRLHALGALDRAARDGADVTEPLTRLATANPDQNLRQYATIALMGIEQGRPGKLNRFFDVMLAQEKK